MTPNIGYDNGKRVYCPEHMKYIEKDSQELRYRGDKYRLIHVLCGSQVRQGPHNHKNKKRRRLTCELL